MKNLDHIYVNLRLDGIKEATLFYGFYNRGLRVMEKGRLELKGERKMGGIAGKTFLKSLA